MATIGAARWHDDERLTPRERMALDYTEAMWHDHRQVDAAFVQQRMLAHFGPDEFVELATLVAQFIGMGQLFTVLGIPNPTVAADEA